MSGTCPVQDVQDIENSVGHCPTPALAAGTDILNREDRSILVRGGSTGLVIGGIPEKEVDPGAPDT